MKVVKIRLRSRMECEFLADYLVVYIEKEITKDFTTEMIMDEFYSMKDRRWAQFEEDTKFFFGIFFLVYVYSKLERFYIWKKNYF